LKIVQVLVASLAIGMLASIGVATALVIPILDIEPSDNTKIYTNKNIVMNVQSGDPSLENVLCDSGDKLISAYALVPEGADKLDTRDASHAFKTGDQEGYHFQTDQDSISPITIEFTVVCAKILPPLTIGGLQIPTDSVSLVLAYGIMNSYWMLPTAVGIGVGIYLVKRKF